MGVYHPERIVTTRELIDSMEHKPQFDLEALTGIKTRRWRSENEDSYTMAIAAAHECLAHSQYRASDIDVLIYSSITRSKDGLNHWFEPSFSKFLKDHLGFRKSVMHFDITNACAGMMTGVFILNNMIRSGVVKNGMVINGECITPTSETAMLEIKEPIDSQFASLTVGDSGAAVVIDRNDDTENGIEYIEFITLAEYSDLCFGLPSIDLPGIAMYTDAIGIHREVIKRLPRFVAFCKEKYHMRGDDYDYIIPHQTSGRAIKTAFELCSRHFDDKIPEILISLDKYGNTASTSHFVVLDDYLGSQKIKKDSRIMFFVLASGIVMGLMSASIKKLEVQYGYGH